MIKYKIEVMIPSDTRMPSLQSIKNALDDYCIKYDGVVITHDSLYDYNYDTQMSDYHNIESSTCVCNMIDVLNEFDKIYIVIESSKELSIDDKYLCYFRSTLASNPQSTDRTFEITNLFAVDLIKLTEPESEKVEHYVNITNI